MPKLKKSRIHLILFALIFGAIGAFFIYRSFAATETVATVETEAMTPPAGASIINDSLASGGKALKFTTNGIATTQISLPSASSSFTVRAKGVQCQGAPQMVVKVDNIQLQTSPVSATSWTDYTTTAGLASGTHTLSVSFAGDYTSYRGKNRIVKCSRDLYVDNVIFYSTATSNDLTVDINPPLAGAVVVGGVAVEAKATSSNGVSKVEFYLGDSPTPTKTDTTAPYCLVGEASAIPCYEWDSTSVANGPYSIKTIAYDTAGNKAEKSVAFSVDNTISSGVQFSLVGTHPYASTQSTTSGKILTGLQEYNGKLYTGYGDTSANTGPIRVMGYDPASNSFVHDYTSATEAIWTYRPINNQLFAPSDDPQSDFSTDYAKGSPWSGSTAIRMTHNFDMAQLGTALYAVGSRDVNAIVAKSTDGGASWSTITSEAPASSGDIARYYFAAVFNNKLYVQAYGYYNNRPHSASKIFDGTSWSTGPNMLPLGGHGWHPKTFGGKLVYQTHLPNNMLNTSGNDKSRLMVFDGTSATSPIASQIYDFAISGSYIYALGVDGALLRSSDLQNWSNLGVAPANSRSLGFLGTTMYVGTADSKLYKMTSN